MSCLERAGDADAVNAATERIATLTGERYVLAIRAQELAVSTELETQIACSRRTGHARRRSPAASSHLPLESPKAGESIEIDQRWAISIKESGR